eukprot:3041508-Prymnesium_polylepis.1
MQGGATVFQEYYKGMVVGYKNVRCWLQHPLRGPAPLPPPAVVAHRATQRRRSRWHKFPPRPVT